MKKKTLNNITFKNKTAKDNEVIDFITMEDMDNTLPLEHMKSEYKRTSIPPELKSGIITAIQKGKKEVLFTRLVKCTKAGGISVAAAMITITILANTNPTISYAMERIPIIGNLTKVVTFRTYSDQTKDFQANINVPQIETDGNDTMKDAVTEVNKSVEEYTDELIAQYEADMKASNGEGNYAMDTSYNVINDTDNILTLRIDTVVAMGGSNSFSKFYHINKKTGVVFDLIDVFKENSDYITLISANIKEQMIDQMAKDEYLTYFYNMKDVEEWNFEAIKPDQNFYFNTKGELVIVFDKYEVAPGYMGEVEFTIPGEITDDTMILHSK
jgi:hypothetical protein